MIISSRSVLGLSLGALLVLAVAAPVTGAPLTPEPYRDPPFACDVIDYGTEPPAVPGPDDEPLCVRYDKTNVTLSDLGIVEFLAAEPGRVGIVAGKCSYWQQDEWVIQVAPGTPPLLGWSGSYWYDAVTASAGGVLRDLRIGGQPASAEAFIEALRPLVGDDRADEFAAFTDPGGGGGMSMSLPEGFGGDWCGSSS